MTFDATAIYTGVITAVGLALTAAAGVTAAFLIYSKVKKAFGKA